MKSLVSILLLVFSFQLLKSQSVRDNKNQNIYKAAFRFNISGLMDPVDNNISIGGEYVFHPHWSVIADIAYITHSAYYSKKKELNSYILRPAIRYYPSKRHRDFFEAVIFYKHINYRMESWLGKDCVNGVPAYEQFQKFIYGKRVAGFNLQGGFQIYSSNDNLFRVEGYGGIGLRLKYLHVVSEENACYFSNHLFANTINPNEPDVLPCLSMGIRLIYCIKD